MKQRFSTITLLVTRLMSVNIFVINSLLWCVATPTIAQRNTKSSILPKPSAAFADRKSTTRSTNTRLTPKLAQTMTLKSSKTVSPEENIILSTTNIFKATRTSFYSIVGVTATTLPSPKDVEEDEITSSKLFLIVGVAVGASLILLIAGIFLVQFFKKRMRRAKVISFGCTEEAQSCAISGVREYDDDNGSFFPSVPRIRNYTSDGSIAEKSPHRSRSAARSLNRLERRRRGLSALRRNNEIFPLPERSSSIDTLSSGRADGETKIPTIENFSKNAPTEPVLMKKTISTEGGVVQVDDIILNIGPGCLAEETEITLIKDDQNIAFQSLLDLGLVNPAPRVVEFLPVGLEFLEPADLEIKFDRSDPSSELFILHGSYNPDYQSNVWEEVADDIVENRTEGVVHVKIHGFSFYSYLLSSRGKIARILSHLNCSFICRAYSLCRRLPEMPTIDIAVVFFTDFVMDEHNIEEDVQQLKDLYEEGYVKGEKGKLRLVHTNRPLEMCLDIPGVESSPFPFKMEVRELDKHGYVMDHFKNIAKPSPVSGTVTINEVHQSQSVENKLLWTLNVREMETEIPTEPPLPIPAPIGGEEPEDRVVQRTTRLTNLEIIRMSPIVGVDWDSLAGLMDIPYETREEIRFNVTKYPDFSSKAGEIFALFNRSQHFGRDILEKCVEELKRPELKQEMLSVENVNEMVEQPREEMDMLDELQLRHTRLTPREMFRLSCRIPLNWDTLAGLMDIAKETREDIRANTMYYDNRARAEKILSIINRQENFSRKQLTKCFEDIKQLDLIIPITTGAWRSL